MVNVLLDDREMTGWRNQTLASCGKLRDPDKHSAFVKISALFFQADFHRRVAADVVAVPIGNVVGRGACSWGIAVSAAQIPGLAGVADVLLTARHDQGQRRKTQKKQQPIKWRTHKHLSVEPSTGGGRQVTARG